MYIADLVCERNARVNEALRGWRGQVRSQQERFAICDRGVLAIMQKRCFLDFSPDRGYRQYCET
jgi:hypothetical protein